MKIRCIFLLFFTSIAHGRDLRPMDGQFNIGQDTITSYEYGIYSGANLYLRKTDGTTITIENTLAYGLTRYSGCEIVFPFFLRQKSNGRNTKGLSDIQCLYQWHAYRTEEHLLALKVGMQFPTGNSSAEPPLGTGSFNPLLNLNAFHASEHIFASFILDLNIATPRKHKKSSTTLDYEITFGPRFPLNTPDEAEWLLFFELHGRYTAACKHYGLSVANTGGNLILFGPIISYDTNRMQLLARFQVPVSDRPFGIQPKTKWLASLIFQYDI